MDKIHDTLPAETPAGAPPSFQESQAAAGLASSSSIPSPSIAPGSGSPAFKTEFACISLNKSDRIRLIDFPPPDFTAVQDVVKKTWHEGIARSDGYGSSREIKLNGYPWRADIDGQDASRVLILRILECLFNRGWVMQASIDMIRKESDKDTLVLRWQNPPPPPCDWLCVSFDSSDKLKIVGNPPKALSQALIAMYGSSIQRHEVTPQRLKIKFNGMPWRPNGTDTVTTRKMLLQLIKKLEEFGYTIYSAMDISDSTDKGETDVLIVQREKTWTPGTPIFHR
ncbi:hypothetical protein F5X68DRAFT_265170 [Plectosphaerella plurivora]|uniref:Uncharacterized protein n=1 Tax=Plectosphaerella plurivora TaxID=936078 RepID=A0A9P8V321_9PEZI|nr:hypothetical protein F5X68DRAFT_265170 [Plectosphaerella plurivora]